MYAIVMKLQYIDDLEKCDDINNYDNHDHN